MFGSLQERLSKAFKSITGRGMLSAADIDATMKEVRTALLEADVNFKVVKDFCTKLAERAAGQDIQKNLNPAQMVIKLVHEGLIELMGTPGQAAELNIKVAPPAVIMLVGLQGSGKTTTAGKLANYLRKKDRKSCLLVPADVYRPAAIEQLKTLGRSLGVPVFESTVDMDPVKIAADAVEFARLRGIEVVILDTAGRLQVDQEMMGELREVSLKVEPHEILLVVDAMTGQEAVNVAKGFDEALDIDGIILTKLDGDARGGAALSMRAVTGKPIKMIGVAEKLDGLELFYPDRMASRILGMGDVLTLIEKASSEVSMEDAQKLQDKFKKNQFSLDDFLQQLRSMRKMGSISSLMSMIPGMDKLAAQVNPEDAEREMKRVEAIILSMTPKERSNHELLNSSRRKRIAKGSGTSVEDINKLIKQFEEMRKLMHMMTKGGLGGLMKMFGGKGGLGNLMRGGFGR